VTVLRDGRRVATEVAAHLDKPQLVALMTGSTTDVAVERNPDTYGSGTIRIDHLAGGHLRDLSVTVRKGEIVGLCGITGSGRDDACPLIFGATQRTGTITIDGHVLRGSHPAESVALGMGLVPADRLNHGLSAPMSVLENITMTALGQFWRRLRLRHREERQAAQATASDLGVKALSIDVPAASLSGGNQQKLVLAKWLRINPRVLLLDQPTQGIDIAAKADVHHLIDMAARRGTAVLVASSDEEELVRLCDRVLVLRSGVVRTELNRGELTARRILHESVADEAPATR